MPTADSAQLNTGAPAASRRRWIKFAVAAGATLLCLSALEVALRLYEWGKYRRAAGAYKESLYQLSDDEKLVYRLSPNFRAELPFDRNREKKFSVVTNNLGFRGPDIGGKTPGVARILFLGDSYPFGWGLSDDAQTYPRQTERLLNESAGARRCEVVNAAVPGYNTEMEAALLRRLAPELQPDAVVLSYVPNDAEPQATVVPYPAQLYRGRILWLPVRVKEGLNKLFGALGAGPAFRAERRWADPDFDYRRGFEPLSFKWKESKAALAEIAALCRERKIPLYVFVIPDFYHKLDDSYPFDGIRETALAWCDELKLSRHDVLADFRGRDHEKYLIPDETHPNAEAHREIAEIMARELAKSPEFAPLVGDR